MKKFILALLALTIILSSCSIEKRIHNPGYHIKWNKSNQNFDRQNLTNNNDERKDSKFSKKELEANVSKPLSNLYSSIEKKSTFNSVPRIEKKSSLLKKLPRSSFSQDDTIRKLDTNNYLIRKIDGGELFGKILHKDSVEILLLTKENRQIYIPRSVIKKIESLTIIERKNKRPSRPLSATERKNKRNSRILSAIGITVGVAFLVTIIFIIFIIKIFLPHL